ncbi:uncharacterized protein TRIADDRAFT_58441 [Trichoplax adhaerens]|uniref:Sepiapterin reductase n=1 Tax=Trichoplax adhaerens TaxID=10228 RepID=B3S2B2_TRIAD|nr:hypothetical protein TRIADDRAFT_58441 [Trichoplax adhaerens]EDV23617.1 hypothetical protein TRIADDRAFT_58441 [Trichoplax adhaerens]|eukprot:XP_002114527.1 hypothetical protein TRIADDRAFT_58441 [Trichoplax adhaerens]
MDSLFSGSLCLIITGASRGFGQAVCVKFAEAVTKGKGRAKFFLLARNENGLAETTKLIKEVSKDVEVQVVCVDVGNLSSLPDAIQTIESGLKPDDYQNSIFIHNAASLESQSVVDTDDCEYIGKYLDLNYTSCHYLSSKYLQLFKNSPGKMHLVNISSICALDPYKRWALYCSMKAARDMLISVIAKENPLVRAVNYAPGPMNTKLLVDALHRNADPSIKISLLGAIEKMLATKTVSGNNF